MVFKNKCCFWGLSLNVVNINAVVVVFLASSEVVRRDEVLVSLELAFPGMVAVLVSSEVVLRDEVLVSLELAFPGMVAVLASSEVVRRDEELVSLELAFPGMVAVLASSEVVRRDEVIASLELAFPGMDNPSTSCDFFSSADFTLYKSLKLCKSMFVCWERT